MGFLSFLWGGGIFYCLCECFFVCLFVSLFFLLFLLFLQPACYLRSDIFLNTVKSWNQTPVIFIALFSCCDVAAIYHFCVGRSVIKIVVMYVILLLIFHDICYNNVLMYWSRFMFFFLLLLTRVYYIIVN